MKDKPKQEPVQTAAISEQCRLKCLPLMYQKKIEETEAFRGQWRWLKHCYDMNILLCITSFKISSFPIAKILKKKCWSFYTFEWIGLILLTGWESFRWRNNSFRERNTLFSAQMQPSYLYKHNTAHAEYRWPLWYDNRIISYQQFHCLIAVNCNYCLKEISVLIK